jgi:hypothetical protein
MSYDDWKFQQPDDSYYVEAEQEENEPLNPKTMTTKTGLTLLDVINSIKRGEKYVTGDMQSVINLLNYATEYEWALPLTIQVDGMASYKFVITKRK